MSSDRVDPLDAQNIEVWSRTAPVDALGAEAVTGPAVVGAAMRRRAMVTGLDLCEAMVAAGRHRYPGVDVRVAKPIAVRRCVI
jgi:hypothetical protein